MAQLGSFVQQQEKNTGGRGVDVVRSTAASRSRGVAQGSVPFQLIYLRNISETVCLETNRTFSSFVHRISTVHLLRDGAVLGVGTAGPEQRGRPAESLRLWQ